MVCDDFKGDIAFGSMQQGLIDSPCLYDALIGVD